MATAKENLEHQLGKDNAGAIDARIDEKLDERLGQDSKQLEQLFREVGDLREQVKDVPDLRERVRQAAAILGDERSGVIGDHNRLVDRRNADEPVSREEVIEDQERVQRVSADVESVQGELAQRVTAIEGRLNDENTGLEALRNTDTRQQGEIDQIRSTANEALRLAQSNTLRTTTTTGSKSGLKAALITFAVVFVFAWLWIMFTNDNESWLWAVAWAGIFGGLVGLVVGIASKEGTRTNTFVGDLRDTRRARKERQSGEQQHAVKEDVEERPVTESRVVERREKVPA